MNCFKLLADNYSEHSIRKAISLESSFIFFKKSTFSSSFVSLITLSLVIKLSLVPGPWGQYLLVPCQGVLQNNQFCSRTLLVEVPQHEECNALLLWWSLNDKSFYKQLTVFRVMNMQWLSLVLKHRSRGWHPPPPPTPRLRAAAELSNELSCSFTCTALFCCFSQFQGELPSLRILLTEEINCQELLNNLEILFKLSKQKTCSSTGDKCNTTEETSGQELCSQSAQEFGDIVFFLHPCLPKHEIDNRSWIQAADIWFLVWFFS